MIQPGAFEQSLPFGKGVQKFQPVVFGVQHHPGMGVETQEGRGSVVTGRNGLQLLDYSPMPHVHTIECPHGQDGGFRTVCGAEKFRCVVMHSHNAKLGAEFRGGRTIFVPDLHA